MTVLVNGQWYDQVSVHDRGLLYGQSVFETIAVVNGQPALLDAHIERLISGCDKLSIPINIQLLNGDLEKILEKISKETSTVLRVTVSMGQGGRGYANPEPNQHQGQHQNQEQNPHHKQQTTRIIAQHDYPVHPSTHSQNGVILGLSEVRLAPQPLLSGIKHGNRLEQILARSQWQNGWHEALLLDTQGNVIEGTQSNIIVVHNDGKALTPKLDQCGVEGVMKGQVLQELKELGFSCQAVRLSTQDIEEADEVLLSNSIIGVWPVKQFLNQTFSDFSTAQKIIKKLQKNDIIPSS